MYRLPDLEHWCQGECWLSTAAAATLSQWLVEPRARDAESWRALLLWEPGLVLWSAAGLRWRLSEPPRLLELAQWLSEQAGSTLQAVHDDQAPMTPAEHAQWLPRMLEAVAVSQLVAHRGGDEQAMVAALFMPFATPDRPAWLNSVWGSAAPTAVTSSTSGKERHKPALARLFDAADRLSEGRPDRTPLSGDVAGSATPLLLAEVWRNVSEGGAAWMNIQALGSQRWAVADTAPLGRIASMRDRLQRLETRFAEQLRQERLESLRELAYGASHELNNPLANITTRAQSLLRDEQEPERRDKLEAIVAQGFRAHEMISDMMLFAKPPNLELERVNLTTLAEQVCEEVRREPEWDGATLEVVSPDEQLQIDADPRHLATALRALCRNSLEATAGKGRIQIRINATANRVEIEVRDDGPGLSPREQQHLFDPFFSGREAGRGLGFGLAKSWSVVRQHGGSIEVLDGLPMRVRIRLPLS
ncbi:MAG: HAMP domain-containing histidine kinase [Planctomycetales bacterium]|nr:HAMP domain-containing histidine kinase [Planctomycetales bacterium]